MIVDIITCKITKNKKIYQINISFYDTKHYIKPLNLNFRFLSPTQKHIISQVIFVNKKLKNFLLNSIALVISSVIFRVLAIFFNSFITQKIGKEMLGTFNLVMSVYLFGITLGNFGINLAITRLVSEELSVGNKEGVKKIAKRCILLSFLCGIIASLLFLLFSDFILQTCLHGKVSKNVIDVMCLAIPLISMSSAISGYFVAIRRVYKSTIAQFFEQIIKILITAFFLELFLPNGLEYACFSLTLGDLISEIFSFICNFLLYRQDVKCYQTSYTTNYPVKFYNQKIFKIATPVAITSFIRSGLSTLKQIAIPISFEKGNMECAKALATYGEINGMAMPIVVFPNVIFSSISSLLVPEFATYNAQHRHKAIQRATTIIFAIATSICILISIFLAIYSEQLATWIYHDLSISQYIKILAPLSIFILLDGVVDNILKGLDAQNSVMMINIFDTLSDVILIYNCVPKFGIAGYIFSIYFSEIFNFVLSMGKLIKIVYFAKEC